MPSEAKPTGAPPPGSWLGSAKAFGLRAPWRSTEAQFHTCLRAARVAGTASVCDRRALAKEPPGTTVPTQGNAR